MYFDRPFGWGGCLGTLRVVVCVGLVGCAATFETPPDPGPLLYTLLDAEDRIDRDALCNVERRCFHRRTCQEFKPSRSLSGAQEYAIRSCAYEFPACGHFRECYVRSTMTREDNLTFDESAPIESLCMLEEQCLYSSRFDCLTYLERHPPRPAEVEVVRECMAKHATCGPLVECVGLANRPRIEVASQRQPSRAQRWRSRRYTTFREGRALESLKMSDPESAKVLSDCQHHTQRIEACSTDECKSASVIEAERWLHSLGDGLDRARAAYKRAYPENGTFESCVDSGHLAYQWGRQSEALTYKYCGCKTPACRKTLDGAVRTMVERGRRGGEKYRLDEFLFWLAKCASES